MTPDDLDTSDLQERLRKAEEAAEQAEDGTEEQRRARATRSAGRPSSTSPAAASADVRRGVPDRRERPC